MGKYKRKIQSFEYHVYTCYVIDFFRVCRLLSQLSKTTLARWKIFIDVEKKDDFTIRFIETIDERDEATNVFWTDFFIFLIRFFNNIPLL